MLEPFTEAAGYVEFRRRDKAPMRGGKFPHIFYRDAKGNAVPCLNFERNRMGAGGAAPSNVFVPPGPGYSP